jgi:RNA polymerase sigma factor FliA
MSTSELTPALERAWRVWTDDREPTAREQLILHYSPIVKFVAGRLAAGLPANVDTGDLISAGVFGLMDALDKFDASHGAKFETYAIPRIRGAILDGLRALDWVPRSVRQRSRAIESAISALEHRLGRAPNDEELAAELGIDGDDLQKWLAAVSVATVGPLDHVMASNPAADPRPLVGEPDESPSALVEDRELRQVMREEMRGLPDRERTVLALYYDEGMTLSEIGSVLGVTESRISQIHTKAVLMLRTRLAALGLP